MFFVLDDHTENEDGQIARDPDQCINIWRQFKEVFAKFESNESVSMLEWKPYVMGYYAALEPAYRALNPIQRKRFVKEWLNYADGNIEETQHVTHGTVTGSLNLEECTRVIRFTPK